jgi:hypothetical protein
MNISVPLPVEVAFSTSPLAQVESNEQLVELWLHGKSTDTCDAYRRDISLF